MDIDIAEQIYLEAHNEIIAIEEKNSHIKKDVDNSTVEELEEILSSPLEKQAEFFECSVEELIENNNKFQELLLQMYTDKVLPLSKSQELTLDEAIQEADQWVEENRDQLRQNAMDASEQANCYHQDNIDSLDINLLDNIIPSPPRSLSINEIILLKKINGKPLVNPSVPLYITLNFHLDFAAVITDLFAFGYLAKSDLAYRMNKTSVTVLKQICKYHGLSAGTKKKADIIELLKASVTPDELNNDFTDYYYVITPKGSAVLDENDYILFYHSYNSSLHIPLTEVKKYKVEHPDASTFEIGQAVLINLCGIKIAHNNISLFRNRLHNLSELYRINNMPTEQIDILYEVSYIDLTYERPFVAPAIIDTIRRHVSALNLSNSDIKEAFITAVNRFEFVNKTTSIEHIADMFVSLL